MGEGTEEGKNVHPKYSLIKRLKIQNYTEKNRIYLLIFLNQNQR